ncbi:tetratricopeptide repeat protein [Oribacterium sp. FC2011]|uniref:tetratricopeptide repeat protein n=1 Tax=Oribacterium sp. FC2011 TaxID=1408311 RepID=UPI0004E0B221|nr:tetratricopeptide repeat protein [Oribacterium sp. FC2011]
MKKTSLIFLELIFLLCLCACASKAQRIEDQLTLGNKYLIDMDYEQAILTFDKVIKIDPKNTDAYIGLGESYYKQAKVLTDYTSADPLYLNSSESYKTVLGLISDGTGTTTTGKTLEEINSDILTILDDVYNTWADIALAAGDTEHASLILDEGYEITKNEEFSRKAQTIGYLRDADKLIDPILTSEITESSMPENENKLIAIADLYDGKYISTENGTGFGIYNVECQYFLYRGGFKNGLRDGKGTITLLMTDEWERIWRADCDWNQDIPYGMAEIYSFYFGEGSYTINGNVQINNGLYDGVLVMDDEYFSTNMLIEQGKILNYSGIEKDSGNYFDYHNEDEETIFGMPGYGDALAP